MIEEVEAFWYLCVKVWGDLFDHSLVGDSPHHADGCPCSGVPDVCGDSVAEGFLVLVDYDYRTCLGADVWILLLFATEELSDSWILVDLYGAVEMQGHGGQRFLRTPER